MNTKNPIIDVQSMNKSEISKNLYDQIQWEAVIRNGVFLQHKDVSNNIQNYFIPLIFFSFSINF